MVSGRYNRDRHAPNKGIAGRGAAANDRVRCVFVRIRYYLFIWEVYGMDFRLTKEEALFQKMCREFALN